MAALNSYFYACPFGAQYYIAVTGGYFTIGEVCKTRGILLFTSASFQVPLEKICEFFELIQQLGENLTSSKTAHYTSAEGGAELCHNDKSAISANEDKVSETSPNGNCYSLSSLLMFM